MTTQGSFSLLQSGARAITKCGRYFFTTRCSRYFKVGQVLLSEARLLQSGTDITNRALHSPEVHQGVSQKRSIALYNSSYMCEGTKTLTR